MNDTVLDFLPDLIAAGVTALVLCAGSVVLAGGTLMAAFAAGRLRARRRA